MLSAEKNFWRRFKASVFAYQLSTIRPYHQLLLLIINYQCNDLTNFGITIGPLCLVPK